MTMKGITFTAFPGGKRKALTFSFDDGTLEDRRLVDIFNKNGLKGTFNLNSAVFGNKMKHREVYRLKEDEIAEVYKGHEIACHGDNHTTLSFLGDQSTATSVIRDREALERICGYPVRGMAYPSTDHRPFQKEILRACGIEYCRNTTSTMRFSYPSDPFDWEPTCHYTEAMPLAERFVCEPRPGKLFYIWGHSFEIEERNDWDCVEKLCSLLGGRSDVWYATNIEIIDYLNALSSLKATVDEKIIYNPTAYELWFGLGGEVVSLKSGETLRV